MSESKVAVCILDTLNVGGAQTNAITFADSLKDSGIMTVFISSGGSLEDEVRKRGFNAFRVNLVRFHRVLPSAARIAKIMKKTRVSVMHAHAVRGVISGYIAARISSVPCIVTIHGELDILPREFVLRKSVTDILSRLLMTLPSTGAQFIVISDELREYAKNVLGVPESRLRVIPNAINITERSTDQGCRAYDIHRMRPFGQEPFIILWVGRTSWDKVVSLATTIDSVALLNQSGIDITLRIAGTGTAHSEINSICVGKNRELSKPAFVCLGERMDISKVVTESDLVIAAGRSAIEALSQGTCVMILSETGYCPIITESNIESVAKTNFSGRGIKPPPSAVDMHHDIQEILANPELRQSSAHIGMRYVNSNLSVEKLSERLIDVYRESAFGKW